MSKYNKFIVAVVGAVIAGLNIFYGPENNLVTLAIAVATALGVYQVPNKK